MELEKMKDKLPFVGSLLLHLGLISGLFLFNLDSHSLNHPKIIPINLVEINENMTNEAFSPRTVFPEKLFFSERNFKNDNKERITHPQEPEAVGMELPLPEPSETPFAECTVFTKGQNGRLRNLFLSKIREKIERVKKYPSGAQHRGIEGKTIVRFVLSDDGEASSISLISSSRHFILDKEAKETVKRASPFPPIPKELKKNEIEITVPITFRLKD